MTQAMIETIGVSVPAPDLNGPQVAGSIDFKVKYSEERNKRLKAEGTSQYIDLHTTETLKRYSDDPWIAEGTPVNFAVPDGGHCKALIVGAGHSGLLFAFKLIKSGFDAKDICIVDPAGGFGGTWYWNRYPGLMCDIESYIYMPLLEEMDYIPTRKYVGGEELRKYAEKVAIKFQLHERAMFQTSGDTASWDNDKFQWNVKLTHKPKGGKESQSTVHADFVFFAAGVLTNPHLPDLPGIADFRGHMFHTSRWDYDYTGGCITDPVLSGLEGKRVGFIGTGATAIQAVPQIAKYATELVVFQRTPSAVDYRGNRNTDAETWKSKVATKPGWWKERNENFNSFMNNVEPKPELDLVDDGWTHAPSYSVLAGSPRVVTMETVGQHLEEMHALDYPRQEGIRRRTAQVVKDPKTAEKLQAWYPTWCKRACFHDGYLPTFNRSNTKLVDTDGKGVEGITEKGVLVSGVEYECDVIVFGTGFRSPMLGNQADKCGMTVFGKDGLPLSEASAEGLDTLHGVISNGFPNMFWSGPFQTGLSPNFTFTMDILSSHVAHIITEARRQAGDGKKFSIQATPEAQDAWAARVMHGAINQAGLAGCTPNYFNKEGEFDRVTNPAQQMKMARGGLWGKGVGDFERVIREWEAKGGLEGLEVTVGDA